MRRLAARLSAHTEMLLLLVILLLAAILDPGQPLFPDPVERRRPDRELFGHGRPGAGRVRRAGCGRDRHLVRRHRFGRAIRHGLCRDRLGPACAALHRARAGRRPGAGLSERGADLLSARRVDHHHHRHHERLLRAPDVDHRRQVDLQSARLVVDPRGPVPDRDRQRRPRADHPADPGGGAGGPAHLAADDPHLRRPPAHRHGRQSRGRAPARHRHRRPCISWPTAISA